MCFLYFSEKYTRFCQWKNLELNMQVSSNNKRAVVYRSEGTDGLVGESQFSLDHLSCGVQCIFNHFPPTPCLSLVIDVCPDICTT